MGLPALRHATALETVFVDVPEDAVAAYEAALASICGTVGLFLVDEDAEDGLWRVEGVHDAGAAEAELRAALELAAAATGCTARLHRRDTPAEGWLARTQEAFPEQFVGRRFAVRGTHVAGPAASGRITLLLDAGIAFGSGEHGSTRGCLCALERVAHRRPRRILDLGTGSGILAMAAAALLHRPVLATDIEPWSVRVAAENAARNRLSGLMRTRLADGWHSRAIAARAPFDLVFANILARPLCAMAGQLAAHLAPGGVAILAGLLNSQAQMVLAAHRRAGLVLAFRVPQGPWTTLVLRKAGALRKAGVERDDRRWNHREV